MRQSKPTVSLNVYTLVFIVMYLYYKKQDVAEWLLIDWQLCPTDV